MTLNDTPKAIPCRISTLWIGLSSQELTDGSQQKALADEMTRLCIKEKRGRGKLGVGKRG